ncbi:hypothetical protein [Bradyrhizobium sp. USDA 3364]
MDTPSSTSRRIMGTPRRASFARTASASLVEFDDLATGQPFFQRMVNHGAGLTVLDPDRRSWPVPETGPFDMSGNHIFWALQPLETDRRGSTALRLAALDATVSEFVGLLSRDGVFDQLDPRCHRDAQPGVWNVRRKFGRMQAVHDTPCLAAQHDQLLSGSQPVAFSALDEGIVELVRPKRAN